MAEAKAPSENPWALLFWFFVFMAFMVLLWFARGAKDGMSRTLTIVSPLSTSTPHSWLPFVSDTQMGIMQKTGVSFMPNVTKVSGYDISPESEAIFIKSVSGSFVSDPSREYITLLANPLNSGPVTVSGLLLRSKHSGLTALIPGGVDRPLIGRSVAAQNITLMPGEQVTVTTGHSPIGVSFRENDCTGYLAQFQTFTPTLTLSCPTPQNEVLSYPPVASDGACALAASTIDRCETLTTAVSDVTETCSQFLTSRLTYNGCMVAHAGQTGFSSGAWRIYLGQGGGIWNNTGDTILLLDKDEKLITAVVY